MKLLRLGAFERKVAAVLNNWVLVAFDANKKAAKRTRDC